MIEPTDEMIIAWRDAMKAAAAEAVRAGAPLGRSQEIVRAGLAAVLAIVERDYRIAPRRFGRGQALHRKSTDVLLREVAEVYRTTKARPVDAVAAHLNCATRTAWLWIRRAREAGHLPKAAQP